MDEDNIKEIDLERRIKEILVGTNYVCMVFPKDLTMEGFLKQIRRKL